MFAREVTMPAIVDFKGELTKSACLAQFEEEAKAVDGLYRLSTKLGPERSGGTPGSSLRRRTVFARDFAIMNLRSKAFRALKVGEVEYLDLVYKDMKPLCKINISYVPLAIEPTPSQK